MRQTYLAIISGVICFHLVGCSNLTVRTSSSREPRQDQAISGNRGFIFGKPSVAPQEPTFTDRKVYRVEIELPQFPGKKTSISKPKKRTDQGLWGNKGYIFDARSQAKLTEQPEPSQRQVLEILPEPLAVTPALGHEQIKQPQTYIVKKGDTLQKIALKFYGTTKKWPLLYEANKTTLKSANRIYPQEVLIIPEVGKREYSK